MEQCMSPLLGNIKKMSIANKVKVMFSHFRNNLYILINQYS